MIAQDKNLRSNINAIHEQIAAARRVTGLVGNPVGPVISLDPLKKLAEKAQAQAGGSPMGVVSGFKALIAPFALKNKIKKITKFQLRHFKPKDHGSKTEGPFVLSSAMMIVLGTEGWHEKVREKLGKGWFELDSEVLYDPSIIGPLLAELREKNEIFDELMSLFDLL